VALPQRHADLDERRRVPEPRHAGADVERPWPPQRREQVGSARPGLALPVRGVAGRALRGVDTLAIRGIRLGALGQRDALEPPPFEYTFKHALRTRWPTAACSRTGADASTARSWTGRLSCRSCELSNSGGRPRSSIGAACPSACWACETCARDVWLRGLCSWNAPGAWSSSGANATARVSHFGLCGVIDGGSYAGGPSGRTVIDMNLYVAELRLVELREQAARHHILQAARSARLRCVWRSGRHSFELAHQLLARFST